jgi:hypothetical protein
MKNLIGVLSLSLLAFPLFGQLKTKKYLKLNKTPERIITIDKSTHSRALLVEKDRFLVGCADGSIFMISASSGKKELLFRQEKLTEIRDLEKTPVGYVAMQSGESSKMISIRGNGDIKIDRSGLFDKVFLDAVDFHENTGFLLGDPVNGQFSLFKSLDGGLSWQVCEGKIKAHEDEAAYAASGTTVQVLNDSTFVFVSGGMKSRFFKSTDTGKTWSERVLPYYPGMSTGPYSLCFASDSIGIMVGGDYKDKDIKLNSCFYTTDGGESWLLPENPTRGYRSCVIHHNNVFYACGTNGIDVSFNGGNDWAGFADGNFLTLTVWSDFLVASTASGELYFYNLLSE